LTKREILGLNKKWKREDDAESGKESHWLGLLVYCEKKREETCNLFVRIGERLWFVCVFKREEDEMRDIEEWVVVFCSLIIHMRNKYKKLGCNLVWLQPHHALWWVNIRVVFLLKMRYF